MILLYARVSSAALWTALVALLPPSLTDGLGRLLQTAADACEALPIEALFSRESIPDVASLEVVAFTRHGTRRYASDDTDRVYREVAEAGRLLLYVPGWWNTLTDDSTSSLVDALLTRESLVLVVDTGLSFRRGYVSAASRVKAVAGRIALLLGRLLARGLLPERTHLLGFSLGAHVAGVAGEIVARRTGRRLGAVTGLDPARPCFTRVAHVISRESATFVQVFHTSVLGVREVRGHVDVYMSEGSRSPDEEHARAWSEYARSARERVMARQCGTEGCAGELTVVGYECNATTRGVFLYTPTTEQQRPLRLFG